MTTVAGIEHVIDSLDPRTVEILERRRGGTNVKRRGWLVRRALLVADVLGLSGAFAIADLLYRAHSGQAGALSPATETATFLLSLPVWVVAIKTYGLYDRDEERADHSTADEFSRMFHLLTVCTFLLYAVARLTSWNTLAFPKLFVFWLFAIAATTSLRAVARGYCRRQIAYLQNAIIVGAGDVGQRLARKLLGHPEYGINLVGFVDNSPRERMPGLGHLTLLGGTADLMGLIQLLDVERVIFAFSSEPHEASLDAIRALNELDIQVDIVPRFFDVLSPGVDLHEVEGLLICGLRPSKLSWSSRIVKRTMDIVGAAVGLLVLAPAFAVIAIAIRFETPGPAFFRQTRRGIADSEFRIWKFRTMSTDAEARKADLAHLNKHLAPGGDPRMFKIDDDPRVTRVGHLLRRWSLDELPQLFNVLKGEMSLVGPRPLIPNEALHVEKWASRRVDLKPGVTGLWQVLGRDAIGFDEMVKLDYLYVTTWSIGRDLALVTRTIPALARGGR